MSSRGTEEKAHRKASPGVRDASVQIHQSPKPPWRSWWVVAVSLGERVTCKKAPAQTPMGWGALAFWYQMSQDQPFSSTHEPSLGCHHVGPGKPRSTQHAQSCRGRELTSEEQSPATPAVNHKPHSFKITVHINPYSKHEQSSVNCIRLCLIHHVYKTCECFLKSRCFSSLIIQPFRIEHWKTLHAKK